MPGGFRKGDLYLDIRIGGIGRFDCNPSQNRHLTKQSRSHFSDTDFTVSFLTNEKTINLVINIYFILVHSVIPGFREMKKYIVFCV